VNIVVHQDEKQSDSDYILLTWY